VFALTFVTAPYALELKNVTRVADVDNLTARMLYETYQPTPPSLERLRRYLAYRKFQTYESELFRHFDLCLVVSERDQKLLAEYVPLAPHQIGLVPNGVDLEHYQPGLYAPDEGRLVYNGAVTYQANYDAVRYFLESIFPQVRRDVPEARLTVTGRTEGVDLQALPSQDGVTFTGFVDDVRPVVGGSSVCVVPLRQGAGTRLKILEAMALGTPVVSTPKGAEGLAVEHGTHLLIADTPRDFARQTVRLLQDTVLRRGLAERALQLVQSRYAWADIRLRFGEMVAALPA
jgi:glycosyltransferase involved in cell wall biosynthesis